MENAAKEAVMKIRAEKITNKYIRDSGPLTVNINSTMSRQIIDIVECVSTVLARVPSLAFTSKLLLYPSFSFYVTSK